ncbi:GDT1-like protein 1, chloroplastic [Tanacetum coccineum]
MLFFGILTFQDAHNALAGSDVGSLMQSSSFFGDLGDISTDTMLHILLQALLAARNSAAVVFTGTFGALGIMTVISVVLGRTFHYVDEILPFRFGDTNLPIDDIAAALLLVIFEIITCNFGVSTVLDASSGDGLKAEEQEVNILISLTVKNFSLVGKFSTLEEPLKPTLVHPAEIAVSEVLSNGAEILAAASTIISTFFLVFVAEWDFSPQLLFLAAASSPLGVKLILLLK